MRSLLQRAMLEGPGISTISSYKCCVHWNCIPTLSKLFTYSQSWNQIAHTWNEKPDPVNYSYTSWKAKYHPRHLLHYFYLLLLHHCSNQGFLLWKPAWQNLQRSAKLSWPKLSWWMQAWALQQFIDQIGNDRLGCAKASRRLQLGLGTQILRHKHQLWRQKSGRLLFFSGSQEH